MEQTYEITPRESLENEIDKLKEKIDYESFEKRLNARIRLAQINKSNEIHSILDEKQHILQQENEIDNPDLIPLFSKQRIYIFEKLAEGTLSEDPNKKQNTELIKNKACQTELNFLNERLNLLLPIINYQEKGDQQNLTNGTNANQTKITTKINIIKERMEKIKTSLPQPQIH